MGWVYAFLGVVAALYVLCIVVGYFRGDAEKGQN